MYKKIKLVLMFFIGLILFHGYTNLSNGLFAATVTIEPGKTHQTIEGFGASIAWYEISLVNHPNKEDIYYHIFNKLGLSILRIRNVYQNDPENFADDFAEIVKNMYKYSDRTPKIMISSWSPPLNIKNVNDNKGGTLKKENGKYVYDAFAKYWVDSLEAYKKIGIVPTYISIQNEPGWTEWDSCDLRETETTDTAGYGRALETVYYALQSLESPPKILAPEILGIGYNTFQRYAEKFNHNFVYGYAYHLYHGGDGNKNSDSFIPNLKSIAEKYSDKPIFQTEYDKGDWFNTAWIIHTSLVDGNVSAYLYWALVWGKDGKALIGMENVNNPLQWTTPEGYKISPEYYAFRQYSKFIYPGWKRVSANVNSDNLRVSAFISPTKDSLTVVILNISDKDEELSMEKASFEVDGGEIIRTSETEQGRYIGKYDSTVSIQLPSRSITTLVLNIKPTGENNGKN